MKNFQKCLLAALIGIGLSQAHAQTDRVAMDESRLTAICEGRFHQSSECLHELFKTYWDWNLCEHPEIATYYGYPGDYHRWPDMSPEAIRRRYAMMKHFQNTLITMSFQDLSPEDRLNYQLFKQTLEQELEEEQFQGELLAISSLQGIHLDIPLFISLMPHDTEQDYQHILQRLDGLHFLVDQTIDCLCQGIQKGITPPKLSLKHLPEQVLNQIVEDPFESPLLTAFKQFPDSFTPEVKDQLSKAACQSYRTAVHPALSKLYHYLIEEYIPHCRSSIAWSDLPQGKEWYAAKVKQQTKSMLSPEDIHAIGLKEVERIHQEMLTVIQDLNFEGTFADFLHFLQTDPQFFYPNSESLLKGYRELTRHIEQQLSKLFVNFPQLPYEVVAIPSFSDNSQIAAYYYPGSWQLQRPGCFFVNTSHPEKRPKWEMEPLALHEAVPGHHLQISLAQELEHIPEFRRHFHCTAYIEGWGLYAESLGKELGLYQNSYAEFGRLNCEMLRAIRLVVDTGMHAKGWSRDQAIVFFKQYVGMNDHEIITEVDRYIVNPGQALAYKIGEMKLQALRQLAQKVLGERFDIRLFHDAWLRQGTLPLNIAESAMHDWIIEQAQQN